MIFDCQGHMLLLLWHWTSALLTCHVAVVFYFCSSHQCWLPSAFPSVTVALWAELGTIPSQTSSHHWQRWFITFCLSLPILFNSVLIFCVYFYTDALSVGKNIAWSMSRCFFPLLCMVSLCVPSHLQICFFFQGFSFPLWIHMPVYVILGMDGLSLISFCSGIMFFQLLPRLNWLILLSFLWDAVFIQGVGPRWVQFCAGIC